MAIFPIAFLTLSACAPGFNKPKHISSETQASSRPTTLNSDAYQKTVYSYVKTVGCAGCHASGPTAAADWFAAPNLDTAFQAALSKVNVENPSASLFAARISDNHCGFPATCGISNTDMLHNLQEWVRLSAAAGGQQQTVPCLFNGQSLASGASAPGFSSATVPFGQTCDTAKINVTCVNGTLNPSTAVATCTVAAGATCSLNGQTVQTGGTIDAYEAARVPFGSICKKEARTCTNGTLSGTFTNASCAVDAAASCSFNGTTIASGGTAMGYPSATVPFGQTCNRATITCTNGVLSPANYVAACTVEPAASCTFNGQTVASGGTVTAYQSGSVPFGQMCAMQTRTCTNGTLSGTYTFASCSVGAAATCSFNGMTIASSGTTTGYPAATVPFGQTCNSSTITCINGALSPANYVPTCTVQPGASCTFNGQTIASGGTVTAYSASTVPFGNTCASVSQIRTCTNGTLSGTFTSASCSVAPPASCTFNGMTIASSGTTTGYPSSTVPFGQTCQSATITCNNGTLTPSNYVASCTVLPGASCAFNGQTIPTGGTAIGYPTSIVPAGQTCSQISVACNNGILTPSGASATCSVSTAATFGSTFVPANQAILLRLNLGLNLPGQKTFYCQNANNCGATWDIAKSNVSLKTDPSQSSGANQVSLLAFSGCNDINPTTWGVNVNNSVAVETNNLINAGVKFVDNHTAGLGSSATYNAQVKAAFQTLISDPAFAGATTKKVFVGICTAAQTFGIGMKGF